MSVQISAVPYILCIFACFGIFGMITPCERENLWEPSHISGALAPLLISALVLLQSAGSLLIFYIAHVV